MHDLAWRTMEALDIAGFVRCVHLYSRVAPGSGRVSSIAAAVDSPKMI